MRADYHSFKCSAISATSIPGLPLTCDVILRVDCPDVVRNESKSFNGTFATWNSHPTHLSKQS